MDNIWIVTRNKQVDKQTGPNQMSRHWRVYIRRVIPYEQRPGEKKKFIKRNFISNHPHFIEGLLLQEYEQGKNTFRADFDSMEILFIRKQIGRFKKWSRRIAYHIRENSRTFTILNRYTPPRKLVSAKKHEFLDTGYVYAPYIPVYNTGSK